MTENKIKVEVDIIPISKIIQEMVIANNQWVQEVFNRNLSLDDYERGMNGFIKRIEEELNSFVDNRVKVNGMSLPAKIELIL